MKRVLVIGCPGSGKSTFARALAERTGLPLFHLDLLYWKTDKTTVSREIFRERVKNVLLGGEWIIDGNYLSTMEWRLSFADTVFFLDYPAELCLEGVQARIGKPHADLPWVEDVPDEEFFSFIKAFSEDTRPQILTLLARYSDRKICIFHTREEADAALASMN